MSEFIKLCRENSTVIEKEFQEHDYSKQICSNKKIELNKNIYLNENLIIKGVIAIEDIEQAEELLQVQNSILLVSTDLYFDINIQRQIDHQKSHLEIHKDVFNIESALIILRFIVEIKKIMNNETSIHAPQIKYLMIQNVKLLQMQTDEDLSLFWDPYIKYQRNEWKYRLEESMNLFIETLKEQKYFIIEDKFLDKEFLLHIFNLSTSRSLGSDVQSTFMCPIGDLFNHGKANSEFQIDINRNLEKYEFMMENIEIMKQLQDDDQKDKRIDIEKLNNTFFSQEFFEPYDELIQAKDTNKFGNNIANVMEQTNIEEKQQQSGFLLNVSDDSILSISDVLGKEEFVLLDDSYMQKYPYYNLMKERLTGNVEDDSRFSDLSQPDINHRVHFYSDSICFKVISNQKISKDTQVVFTQGPNTSKTLLMQFGFSLHNNFADQVRLNVNVNEMLINDPQSTENLEKIQEVDDKPQIEQVIAKFKNSSISLKLQSERLNQDIINKIRLYNSIGLNNSKRICNISSNDGVILTCDELITEQFIIEKVRDLLEIKLKEISTRTYSTAIEDEKEYVRYFAAVWNQKCKFIIENNIIWVNKVLELLEIINNKKDQSDIIIDINTNYRKQLYPYLNTQNLS